MTETPIVHVVHADLPSPDVVFVERKGVGHPDTLADHLAELLSQRYSQFTLKNYGAGMFAVTAPAGPGSGALMAMRSAVGPACRYSE